MPIGDEDGTVGGDPDSSVGVSVTTVSGAVVGATVGGIPSGITTKAATGRGEQVRGEFRWGK